MHVKGEDGIKEADVIKAFEAIERNKPLIEKKSKWKTQPCYKNIDWRVYILASTHRKYPTRTYVGMTNDVHHRLKQHNREKKGGAWATETKGPFHHTCIISGFFDRSQSRLCEISFKRIASKSSKFSGPLGRIKSVLHMFKTLTKWQFWVAEPKGPSINEFNYTIHVLPKYAPMLDELKAYDYITIKLLKHDDVTPIDENDPDCEAKYEA